MTGRNRAQRLLLVALVLSAAATAAFGLRAFTFGYRPAYVNVRWAPTATADDRRERERRFQLTGEQFREGTTWGYILLDVSRENIRALVMDPAIEDTHNIHRTAFRPWRTAPRAAYRTTHPWIPSGLDVAAALLGVLASAAAFIALVEWQAKAYVRGPIRAFGDLFLEPGRTVSHTARRLSAWIDSRIPETSAEAVGLFRIILGCGLMWLVLRDDTVDAAWAANPTNDTSAMQAAVLGWFVAMPALAQWITPWVVAWGLLFIVGVWARVSFAMLVLGSFGWAMLATTQVTYHSVCALLTALVCLLWSRWGDALSVDAWWRRGPPARTGPRQYGYTTWLPGFVLGITFAAAALAKLRESGIAWILNGTVKYHFLTDSRQAPLDWGTSLGAHHGVAVAMSLGAVLVEALVIAAVFTRAYRWRALAGVASLMLLSGFTFLQGIFWPGWWLLTLSFLPWHRVGGSAATVSVAARQVPGATIALAVLAMQVIVSTFKIEGAPLFSTYDMYATTYESPAEFEAKAGEGYFLVGTDGDGAQHECRLTPAEHRAMTAGDTSIGRKSGIVGRCFPPPMRVRDMYAETVRIRVDWERWQLQQPHRVRVPAAGPPS